MKKFFLLIAALCCMATVQAQTITMASYNIRYNNPDDVEEGNGWTQRCPHLCEIINYEQPLFFGAQEVLVDQLHDMLKLLPDYHYLGVGRDDGKEAGEYAAIFYLKDRLEVVDHGHFWLSETPEKPSRGWDAVCVRICTWALFKDKQTKQQFYVFNLHMDHVGTVARRESAKLVIQRMKEFKKQYPMVLTGDFNVDETNEIYLIFTKSGILKDAYESAVMRMANTCTWNDFMQDCRDKHRIDHIFVSSDVTVERYAILTESYWLGNTRRNPSDHYPVFAKLKWATKK